MFAILLLLLAKESIVKVPPTHWTAIALKTDHRSTTVHVDFEVRNGGNVQALVMTRGEAERFDRGRSTRSLYSSGFQQSARFRLLIAEPGDYVLLLDDRLEARFPAEVALVLDTTYPDSSKVRYVPVERQRMTVALSLLFFGACVVFSAVKFLRS